MIRRAIPVFMALLALTAAAVAQTGPNWRKDFDAGLKEAKAANKLVMIDFFTEW